MSTEKEKFPLKKHIIAALISLAALLLDLGCPVARLLKVPCPTCGVTRAIISLLRFDFSGYLSYNFMAVFLISAVWLFIHRSLFKNRMAVNGYVFTVLAVNTVRYAVVLAEAIKALRAG